MNNLVLGVVETQPQAEAGALVGMGIPEIEAKRYEGKIKGGNSLIAVHVDDGEAKKRARKVLESGGAHDVVATSETSTPDAVKAPRVR